MDDLDKANEIFVAEYRKWLKENWRDNTKLYVPKQTGTVFVALIIPPRITKGATVED